VEVGGRTVAFLSSFVTDLQAGRLRPYAQLGGGIANVRRKVTIDYPPGILAGMASVVSDASMRAPSIDGRPLPIPRPVTTRIAENDLALTAGAGLDVRVWRRLSLAADVRYLRLFETTQGLAGVQNITRIGARVSWWF
jgi:opacity protein-like surface antigen